MSFRKRQHGCKDGCSFFLQEYDFSRLPRQEQIAIEKKLAASRTDDDSDVAHLHKIFIETKKGRCVGGLLKEGEVRTGCRCFTELPETSELGNLITLFTAKHAHLKERPWKIATFVLPALSLLLGFVVANKTSNEEWSKKVEEQEKIIAVHQLDMSRLRDSLEKLTDENTRLAEENKSLSNAIPAEERRSR